MKQYKAHKCPDGSTPITFGKMRVAETFGKNSLSLATSIAEMLNERIHVRGQKDRYRQLFKTIFFAISHYTNPTKVEAALASSMLAELCLVTAMAASNADLDKARELVVSAVNDALRARQK